MHYTKLNTSYYGIRNKKTGLFLRGEKKDVPLYRTYFSASRYLDNNPDLEVVEVTVNVKS